MVTVLNDTIIFVRNTGCKMLWFKITKIFVAIHLKTTATKYAPVKKY